MTQNDYNNRLNVSTAAVGWTAFAAFMMVLIGFFHAFAGLAGILEDEFYVVTPNYLFELDATTWGWIHLLGGILVFCAGIALFSGAIWARTVGVLVAIGSAILTFAWLPLYPIWGIAILAVDVSVIWALTAHGRDIAAE